MEFAYDGGGLAKGGTAALFLDGKPIGEGRIEATVPMIYSGDETCDVGRDTGTPVSEDYTSAASEFTGKSTGYNSTPATTATTTWSPPRADARRHHHPVGADDCAPGFGAMCRPRPYLWRCCPACTRSGWWPCCYSSAPPAPGPVGGLPDRGGHMSPGRRLHIRVRAAGRGREPTQQLDIALRAPTGIRCAVPDWRLGAGSSCPQNKTEGAQPSRVSKAVAGSGLLAVFVVGLAMYTPSPTYLAALDVVGGTKMSTAATAAWVVIVVILVLITIEIPILLYFVAPGWTIPKLQAFDGWLDRNGRTLLVYVLAVLGVWQVIDGLFGLLQGRPRGARRSVVLPGSATPGERTESSSTAASMFVAPVRIGQYGRCIGWKRHHGYPIDGRSEHHWTTPSRLGRIPFAA